MVATQFPFAAVTQITLDAQIARFITLAQLSVDSMGRLIDLNLNTAKKSIEESTTISKALFEAKDLQEVTSLFTALAKPSAEKGIAYCRHLANIAAHAQSELNRATEEQLAEMNRTAIKLVDDAEKNAPAGTENVVAIVKSAIGNAEATYEQFAKTTRQAGEAIEASINAAAVHFEKPV